PPRAGGRDRRRGRCRPRAPRVPRSPRPDRRHLERRAQGPRRALPRCHHGGSAERGRALHPPRRRRGAPMSFLTAYALAIALFVGAPVLAHLLRRRKAEERPFPPARLVPPTPPAARRRSLL